MHTFCYFNLITPKARDRFQVLNVSRDLKFEQIESSVSHDSSAQTIGWLPKTTHAGNGFEESFELAGRGNLIALCR